MIGSIIDLLWRQPARVVALSFFSVAVLGALILSLPIARTGDVPLAPIDAFFTATSAVCVTGLIVVDTPVYFSAFGEGVLLILIQIGGLGIMAFSLSAVFLTRKRLSVGESELLSFMLNEEDRTSLRGQLVKVLLFTFLIEFIGASLLLPFVDAGEGSSLWFALFHAVSAFCNAGFSLHSDSLMGYADNVPVNVTISALILLGGIGFATLSVIQKDLHVYIRGKFQFLPKVFQREHTYAFDRSESSRVALWGTIVLLVAGAIAFYAVEGTRALRGTPLGEKYLVSLFQSVTLRTAGFNTIDFSILHRGTLLVMVPFMFIGAASGGTAGGIKIGTIAVVWSDIKRFVIGKRDAVLFFRRVPRRTISQAYVLVVAGGATVLVAAVVLAITETATLEVIIFEIVSALGTVGLSAGLTGELTAFGKSVIIVLMFLGRLGPLTLFLAFRPRKKDESVRYPDANLPIG